MNHLFSVRVEWSTHQRKRAAKWLEKVLKAGIKATENEDCCAVATTDNEHLEIVRTK